MMGNLSLFKKIRIEHTYGERLSDQVSPGEQINGTVQEPTSATITAINVTDTAYVSRKLDGLIQDGNVVNHNIF